MANKSSTQMNCNDNNSSTNCSPMKLRLINSPMSVSTTSSVLSGAATSSHSPIPMSSLSSSSSTSPGPNTLKMQMHDQWSGSDSNSSPKTIASSSNGSIAMASGSREIHERHVLRLSKRKFRPLYPARAHLNVFSAKETTKDLLVMIAEDFEDEQALYYYSDISTALQMNDGQMFVWCLSVGRKVERVSFIHYDLHCRATGKVLYAVVVPNASKPGNKQRDKWVWRVETFLTAKDIEKRYGVTEQELPRSSRSRTHFRTQLFGPKTPITELLVEETMWHSVQQIKSLKRGRSTKTPKLKIKMTEREWKDNVKRSLSDDALPMAPVVVNRNNQHWIEWVKMVRIDSYKVFVGISCRDMGGGFWKVQSMDLDAGRIYNKYRLVGLDNKEFDRRLKAMKTRYSIVEIQFIRNQTMGITDGSHTAFSAASPFTKSQLSKKQTALTMPPRMQGVPAGEQWIDDIVDNVLQKEQKVPSHEMYKFQNFGNQFGGSIAATNYDQTVHSQNYQNYHQSHHYNPFPKCTVGTNTMSRATTPCDVVHGNPVYLAPATAATMDAMNVNHQHYVAFPAMYVQTMANPVVYNNGNGTSTAPQTMYYQPVAVPAEYVQSGFY